MTPVRDESARTRIRTSLDETLVVEAAAGTGKTTELVHRIVNVLAEGRARVDQIAAVTFTEKAAGELKLRLRAELEQARQEIRSRAQPAQGATHQPSRQLEANVEQALAHLEEAHVSTIHGFCADLLRERPVEAKIDPRFEVLLEPDARWLHGLAFDLWLQEVLEDPPEGIRRSLRRTSRARPFRAAAELDDERPTGRLRTAGWALTEWRDFPGRWRRDPFERERQIDELVPRLHDFAAATRRCSNTRDVFYRDTASAQRLSDAVRASEKVGTRDYDGLEAQLVDLTLDRFRNPGKGYDSNWQGGVSRAEVRKAHEELLGRLQMFSRAADADLAACLRDELAETIERYEELKQGSGRLDFVDLLVRARDLVRDHDPVRHDFQNRFTHIFVDEFQDTDPLQAEILLLLAAADPAARDWRRITPQTGKLFIVGDPKQSIYRFRRADVGVYHEVKEQLVERGAKHVPLTTSFRASPSIQNMVNAAFHGLMTWNTDTLQADYVPLSPSRADPVGQPSLVALPVPEPYSLHGNVTQTAIEGSLPNAVGAFVKWLIDESGWTVTEGDQSAASRQAPTVQAPPQSGPTAERPVPIAARHVCLLFRRFEKFRQDMTRGYVEALEARGIPHLLVGGKTFHVREEVETMRAALAAVEWPDDELSVFATLRGSLFAINDELLLEYRHRFGRPHPFRIPPELGGVARDPHAESRVPNPDLGHLLPVAEALSLLRSLHGRRNYVAVTETIGRLLEATRAHAGFVMRPSGEQALANVLQLAELARQYETGGGISFRGFVEKLQEEAESSQVAEAPILEEGSEGVRIMTVHKAKGLEFPVVILADITCGLVRERADRHIDPDGRLCALRIGGWTPADLLDHEEIEVRRAREEGVRIAYVAATRARDLLVVPAIGDQAYEKGWASPLNAAIYPPVGRRRSSDEADGCPRFGKDSVLERVEGRPVVAETVCPGLHSFKQGEASPASGPWPSASSKSGEGEASPTPGPRPLTPGYAVIWWDPRTLSLDVPAKFGLRQEELIGKEAPRDVVQADLQTYRAWRRKRDVALDRGSEPSLVVHTVTERAAEAVAEPSQAPGPADVPVVEVAGELARPSGPRYGTLVHAVLATVPLEAAPAHVTEVAVLQGRILGATDAEVSSAAAVVSAALGHSLMDRAREAAAKGACRRETPVTFREPDASLVEGVVDLAFQEGGAWTVVDFKTDRELEKGLDVYRRQVRLYADIVASATGQPASAVLMRV